VWADQEHRGLELHHAPDACWYRDRGAGGSDYPPPITASEQAALLRKKPNKIVSVNQWPAGKRTPKTRSGRVYRRGDFEVAMRKHEAARERGGPQLRLVTPTSD